MHSHLRIEARHVFIAPSKDINILMYEGYERLLFYWRQAFAYGDELWMFLITDIDLDHFIFDQRFALFKMLLSLKIKLLSSRISVEELDVFVFLCLTSGCHIGRAS